MYNKQEIPFNIVQYYLKNRISLRKTARRFGIHYQTLFKWVKLYKKGDKEKLLANYRRPWTDEKSEEKVVFLKESIPSLTTRKAKEILQKEGIKISLKGIWGIWKRYGYAGFKKKNFSGDFREYIYLAPETKEWINQAKAKIKKGKVKQAAKILNDLPFCNDPKILAQVPNRLLHPKRKLEKLPTLFRKIPFPLYLRKIRNLKKLFLKKEYLYSGIRAALEEIRALIWLGRYEEGIYFIEEIENMIRGNKKILMPLPLLLYLAKGIVYIPLYQIDKAIYYLNKCRRFSRYIKSPMLLVELANFCTQLAFFTEAESLLQRAIKYTLGKPSPLIYIHLANILILKGDCKGCIKIIKEKILETEEVYKEFTLLLYAQAHLGLGQIEKANEGIQQALLFFKKMGILPHIKIAAYTLSSLYSTLGEEKKAKNILKRYQKLLIKYGLKLDFTIWEIILGGKELPKKIEKHRGIKLALLLRKSLESKREKDFQKAYLFAKRHGLLGTFHRLCLLMPESARSSIEKGKPTGLPKTLLKLPVFNREIPVYNIKFLGNLIVYKNQKYLRVKLPPKDTAFLIHLALKAGAPGKRISLENLYNNYWQNSKNPSRNLSHLLIRAKKALKIPTHLLEVSYKKDNPVLINKGIYFTTDYGEFEQILIHAKALHRADEWGFARKEYLRAFALIREEPFKKMYDNWSEGMRRVILNQLETEATNFAKSCLEHKNKKDAKKVLQKILKITPYLVGIKTLLKEL